MSPIVCAVMVTGKPGREYLAWMAIKSFLEQTYPQKKLLIVNDGEPLFPKGITPPGIRELQLHHPKLTLGRLRNIALEEMDKDVTHVVQWDDDDYSDPLRLSWQVAQQRGQGATVMRYATHCNLQTGEMKICSPTKSARYGFAGTIMHAVPTPFRYPEKAAGEDSEFSRQWRTTHKLRVLINDRHPTFYVRFFHGANTWDERHVMGFPSNGMKLSSMQKQVVTDLRERYLKSLSARSCTSQPAGA